MNRRTATLMVAVSLVAPLIAACTRPPTSSTSIPAGSGKDCGTINISQPSPNDASIGTCFLGYHGFATLHLQTTQTTAQGVVKTMYQTQSHTVTVYRQVNNGPVTKTECTGATSQFSVGADGVPIPLGCKIPGATGGGSATTMATVPMDHDHDAAGSDH